MKTLILAAGFFSLSPSFGQEVVCQYHTSQATLGGDVIGVVGWRPTSVLTGRGLGRCPTKSEEECERVVEAAKNGIVCTNTCIGWKVTQIEKNNWCGSSVALEACLASSVGSKSIASGVSWACSYPADGEGKLAHWVATRVSGQCDYIGGHKPLDECKKEIAEK